MISLYSTIIQIELGSFYVLFSIMENVSSTVTVTNRVFDRQRYLKVVYFFIFWRLQRSSEEGHWFFYCRRRPVRARTSQNWKLKYNIINIWHIFSYKIKLYKPTVWEFNYAYVNIPPLNCTIVQINFKIIYYWKNCIIMTVWSRQSTPEFQTCMTPHNDAPTGRQVLHNTVKTIVREVFKHIAFENGEGFFILNKKWSVKKVE